METIAYKLFRLNPKTGNLHSLFINRGEAYPYNTWIKAHSYPTKGYAVRPGWHCTAMPTAPHLNRDLANGEHRVWRKVLIKNYEEIKRPVTQGGLWYLAKQIKILDREPAYSINAEDIT